MSYLFTPNQETNGIYRGVCYVFDAKGGFKIERDFSEIKQQLSVPFTQFDVTDSLQLYFSVRAINNKIGIIKDSCNNIILQELWDSVNQKLVRDSLNVTSSDFKHFVNTRNIVSMGKLSKLYSDFDNTVKTYFGAPLGFASYFNGANFFNVNCGVFDASALIRLINGNTFDHAGSVISDLSGTFTVSDVTGHLNSLASIDVFRNRPFKTDTDADASCNCCDSQVYSAKDGFLAGDLIYIPDGIQITLSLPIQLDTHSPTVNVGPKNLESIVNDISYNLPRFNVTKSTTASVTNITQTFTVPILLILTNEDVFVFDDFGKHWSNATEASIGPNNWLCISISASGQHQSAIDEDGNIFISSDFGITWESIFNIGLAVNEINNAIAISTTGQYQTASNGLHVYISNDYGSTWAQVYSLGTSHIFVSMSLNGQYQTIVSCGDSLYTSNNYGYTWTRLNDDNSDLYNSIESFPTCGVSISYNGQYQTIVGEDIYISKDYGKTWKNVSLQNNLDDRNWEGISISSNGQIQTAIESGGDIYISRNYGETWTFIDQPNLINQSWQAVSISATGQYQTAIELGGSIFVSLDYGVTWNMTQQPDMQNRQWHSISVSANAQYQTIVEYGGGVFISQLV